MSFTWNEIFDWAGLNVRDIINAEFDPGSNILDVGAGQGKYRILLNRFARVDGVEIHERTIADNCLHALYRSVYCGNITNYIKKFESARRGELLGYSTYDAIIFGDVLEHLEIDDAQDVVNRALKIADDVFVIVPYLYPQEPHDDNEHQRHIQDDLTPEIMFTRYPGLRLVMLESHGGEPFKGIYRGR